MGYSQQLYPVLILRLYHVCFRAGDMFVDPNPKWKDRYPYLIMMLEKETQIEEKDR